MKSAKAWVATAFLLFVACGSNACDTPLDAADASLDPPDAAADAAEPPTCSVDCPELILELTGPFGNQAPPAGYAPVRVGLFVSVSADAPMAWTAEQAERYVATIVDSTEMILDQCNLYLEVETAAVIGLPATLLDILANEPGSFGGHPPPGIENVELFNYEQNETLTDETRRLFEFAKRLTSRNTIAAITVNAIEYYAEGEFVDRGPRGLSFPPNNYRRIEDYPARNSVLLAPPHGEPGTLPSGLSVRTLAHELGHMVLNVGDHVVDPQNLMSGASDGTTLDAEQCRRFQANLVRLFGEDAVPDPGPPN